MINKCCDNYFIHFSKQTFFNKQAWGVLEQRVGNLSYARRLFRSSLNVSSQSYVTWMTWASLEEDQGNPERADEIRDLYFQQVTVKITVFILCYLSIYG